MRHTKTLMPATSKKTSQPPSAPAAPRGRQRFPTAGSDEKRERILKAAEALFDRNGYIYHGRVKAVADGAREAGLEF